MDTVRLNGVELREFQIVIPTNASTPAAYTARDIRCFLAQKYGYALEIVKSDATRRANEIVIELGTDSETYDARIADGRISLIANGMLGFDAAWSFLRDEVLLKSELGESGAYELPTSLTHTGSANEAADDAESIHLDGDERVLFYNLSGHNTRVETSVRMMLQLEIFRTYQPGVIGFQEFHPISNSNGFKNELFALGYAEAPYVLPSNNTRNNNYTPIYYLASRYTLLDSGYRLYQGRNDASSKGLSYAVLENRLTGKRFAVITTHYWWEWNDETDNETRRSNSRELLETALAIREKFPGVAVVAGGDLNHDEVETEGNPIWLLEQNGFDHAFKVAREKDDRAARIGYPQVFNETYMVYTAWKMPMNTYFAGRAIDHALVMGDVTVENYHRILDRYALLSSDHAPHFVDITLPEP